MSAEDIAGIIGMSALAFLMTAFGVHVILSSIEDLIKTKKKVGQ